MKLGIARGGVAECAADENWRGWAASREKTLFFGVSPVLLASWATQRETPSRKIPQAPAFANLRPEISVSHARVAMRGNLTHVVLNSLTMAVTMMRGLDILMGFNS